MAQGAYELNYQGIRRLLSQVLILALEDLDRKSQRKSAEEFFNSEMLDWMSDELDLNSTRIRRQVVEGIDPKPLRNARRAHKSKNGALNKRAALLQV